jgi:predicted RNA-binding protein with PIN domain
MHSFQNFSGLSEDTLSNIVFDAVRGNEERKEKTIKGFEVSFTPCFDQTNEEFYAQVMSKDGFVIARCVIDSFDC